VRARTSLLLVLMVGWQRFSLAAGNRERQSLRILYIHH
jgi:hypothetical protein